MLTLSPEIQEEANNKVKILDNYNKADLHLAEAIRIVTASIHDSVNSTTNYPLKLPKDNLLKLTSLTRAVSRIRREKKYKQRELLLLSKEIRKNTFNS